MILTKVWSFVNNWNFRRTILDVTVQGLRINKEWDSGLTVGLSLGGHILIKEGKEFIVDLMSLVLMGSWTSGLWSSEGVWNFEWYALGVSVSIVVCERTPDNIVVVVSYGGGWWGGGTEDPGPRVLCVPPSFCHSGMTRISENSFSSRQWTDILGPFLSCIWKVGSRMSTDETSKDV